MADIFVDRTTNFDGSASPITATGPIALACTGQFGKATLKIWGNIDSSDPQVIYQSRTKFMDLLLLPSGADWYAELIGVEAGTVTSLTLSYLDA